MEGLLRKLQGIEKGIDEGYKTYRQVVNRKADEDLRTERAYIRLTKEEKEMLKVLAKLKHQSVSDFIRLLIFEKYLNDFVKINN